MPCPQGTADTNRVSLFYSIEECWGEAIGVGALAPKMYEVRMTGESLGHAKQTVTSNTIRTDRMRDTISEVAASAEGDISFELAAKDWDLMIEGVLANDTLYATAKTFTGVASAVNASNTFTVSVGDFAGFVVGAYLFVEGFDANAANNGAFQITAVAGNTITVSGGVLTDETPAGEVTFSTDRWAPGDLAITGPTTVNTATGDFTTQGVELGQYLLLGGFATAANNVVVKVTAITANDLTVTSAVPLVAEAAVTGAYITGKRVKNGRIGKSFLLEKHFGDIDRLMNFSGMRPGSMSLAVESNAIVTGSITFMGKEGQITTSTISGSRVDATVSDALNATTNVGEIEEGGVAMTTAIRGLTLEIANNLRTKPQVGSRSPTDIGYGFIDCTGTVNAYFEDETLVEKVINHTESNLAFRFTDSDENVVHVTLPRLYFTSGMPLTPGGNEDVMVPLEYTCVRDATTDSVIIFDLLTK